MRLMETKEGRWGTALAALFLLLQFYLIFLRHHDTMDLEVYPNTKPSQNFGADFTVGQSFKAGMDRLNRIDALMGTHGKTLGGEVVLRLRELPPPSGPPADLRVVRIKASEIRDNLYQTFSFPPIPDSKGKRYSYEVFAVDPDPGTPGCLWINEADIYPEGDFLVQGKVNGGDCAFRTYSSRTIASQARRIARRWPRPFGTPAFFWLVLAAFVASLTALLYHVPGLFADPRPDKGRP